MKNYKKGFAIPLVIAIVSILAIGGGMYLVSKNNDNTSENSQAVVSANSKTYQNDAFGFGFDYPSDLTVVSSGPNDEQKKVMRGEMISGTVPPTFDAIIFSNSANKEQFNVIIFGVTKQEVSVASTFSSGTTCDSRFQISNSEIPTPIRTLVTKNGVLILEERVVNTDPKQGDSRGCYFFKNNAGNLIVFNISGFAQKADFLQVFNLVADTILPTLRVSQNNETANWKTYTNIAGGFSFAYPETWNIEEDLQPNMNIGLNLFSSVDHYQGDTLKQDVMKAQFQLHTNKEISNQQQYIDRLRAHPEETSLVNAKADIEKMQTGATVNMLKIKNGIGTVDYVVPLKPDFSQVLYVIVWNPDPLFEKVITGLKVSAVPSTTAVSLKTFTDPTFNFAFSYPSDFALSTELTRDQTPGSYSISCDTTSSAVEGTRANVCLWYIGGKNSDGFEAADLQVRVTPTAADCKIMYERGPGIGGTETKVINGITYYVDGMGDASAGHRLSSSQYRTYYYGNCYTIALNVGYNRGKLEKELSPEFINMMFAKLESIFSTFRFTK